MERRAESTGVEGDIVRLWLRSDLFSRLDRTGYHCSQQSNAEKSQYDLAVSNA